MRVGGGGGVLGLVLMGGYMLSKSLIQFSVEKQTYGYQKGKVKVRGKLRVWD